jgi:hypothetical protein
VQQITDSERWGAGVVRRPVPRSYEERVAVLINHGWRPESETATHTTFVKGSKINHILHLLLTLLTAGLWGIVWIVRGLVGGERRIVVRR